MLDNIKKSPMFNLFLSSKELFHSNFIDWLTNKYPNQLSKVFSNLLDKDIKIIKSERETKNFDLIFRCENKDVVIENKFKSIIKKDQLYEYNKKLSDEIRILLTLHKSSYEEKICKETNWKIITYEEFIKELEKIKLSDEYHNEILKDYCYFVKEIINLFLDKNYLEYTIKEMKDEYKILKEIRLHDIQQKIIFNDFLVFLESKLKRDNYDYDLGYNFSKNISIWDAFSRGTGLISLNYTIDNKEEFRLEIQLQFNLLRTMLIKKNPKDVKIVGIRTKYFKVIENFSKTKYIREIDELFPKGEKNYNKYGNNNIYKNVVINENIKFRDLLDDIYRLFKDIIEIGDEYRNEK